MSDWGHVEPNLRAIQARVPSSVTLVAVSKTFPVEAIQVAYDLGHRDFGESRLQEAFPKIDALPKDIRWHFVGTLQSNKARRIGDLFHLIHTVCTLSQLKELEKCEAPCPVLFEVNVGEESQKAGIFPGDLPTFHKSALEYAKVDVKGLMTVGPAHPNAERMRLYFRQLRQLAEENAIKPFLSMGMSNDFDVAIQEGASHVRIGSAIFGRRET